MRHPAPFQQPFQRLRKINQGARRARFREARGVGDNWSRIAQSYENILLSSPFHNLASNVKVGARLLKFAVNWGNVTEDQWVLRMVATGVYSDFLREPRQISKPATVVMSKEMGAICDQEVKELLTKGAIIEISDESEGFVCSLFVIPKRMGGFRPIVNLKPLNKFIEYEHFKMENLQTVRFLLREGDWMVKLDLKDAYLAVPVHASHKKSCQVWLERAYLSVQLSGIWPCPSPENFTKILKVVMAFARRQGVRLVIYLDDILIINDSRNGAFADLGLVMDLLQSLGLILNFEKSILDPTQSIEFLGLLVNSLRLSFALPTGNVQFIKDLCVKMLAQEVVSLREIASIIWNFTWAIPTIPFAQAHYRSMQRFYIEQAQKVGFDLKVKCNLTAEARTDLEWRVENPP